VAEVRVAALLDALDRGAHRGDDVVAGRLGPERPAGAQERGAPDRPRGAADALGEHDRGLLEQRARVGVAELVPVAEHDLEAARERVAEVAVADDRVELAEVGLVVDRRLGDRPDDELGLTQRGHFASSCGMWARRSARVITGSSRLLTTSTASLK